jgi:hypothetical protein
MGLNKELIWGSLEKIASIVYFSVDSFELDADEEKNTAEVTVKVIREDGQEFKCSHHIVGIGNETVVYSTIVDLFADDIMALRNWQD